MLDSRTSLQADSGGSTVSYFVMKGDAVLYLDSPSENKKGQGGQKQSNNVLLLKSSAPLVLEENGSCDGGGSDEDRSSGLLCKPINRDEPNSDRSVTEGRNWNL